MEEQHKECLEEDVRNIFTMKVVRQHTRPLSRELHEAIRIIKEGAKWCELLNSKMEYTRCFIPNLVVEERSGQITRQKEIKRRTLEDRAAQVDKKNTSNSKETRPQQQQQVEVVLHQGRRRTEVDNHPQPDQQQRQPKRRRTRTSQVQQNLEDQLLNQLHQGKEDLNRPPTSEGPDQQAKLVGGAGR